MTDKSVLVTGGAGFIGSHLAERCLERGWRVVAIDAFTDYYDEQLKRRNVARALGAPGYALIEADLLELDLEELVRPATVVFHLAAQPGVRISWAQFELYARQNVIATHRLLEAARSASLERVVIASSSSVYGDAETLPTREDVVPRPVSPYGVTKVATEQPQRGDAWDTAADISRARGDLGYEPSYEFHAGLESQLAWQQALLETTERFS